MKRDGSVENMTPCNRDGHKPGDPQAGLIPASKETAATVETLAFTAETLASSIAVLRRQLRKLLTNVQQAVTAADSARGIVEILVQATANTATPVDNTDNVEIAAIAPAIGIASGTQGSDKLPRPILRRTEDDPIVCVFCGVGATAGTPQCRDRLAGAIGFVHQQRELGDVRALVPSIVPVAMLTPRQREVLDLLRRGKPNREIALDLGLAEATVRTHVTAIFKTLRVRNRTQAVLATGGAADPVDG